MMIYKMLWAAGITKGKSELNGIQSTRRTVNLSPANLGKVAITLTMMWYMNIHNHNTLKLTLLSPLKLPFFAGSRRFSLEVAVFRTVSVTALLVLTLILTSAASISHITFHNLHITETLTLNYVLIYCRTCTFVRRLKKWSCIVHRQ